MKLTHLGISHFRSIGETPVMIDLTKKITVLVGQNDCGKSNVLRGMELLSRVATKSDQLTEIEFHKRKPENHPRAYVSAVDLKLNNQAFERIASATLATNADARFEKATWKELHEADGEAIAETMTVLGLDEAHYLPKADEVAITIQRTDHTGKTVQDKVGNSVKEALAKQLMYRLCRDHLPAYCNIPQFRRIDNSAEYKLDGKGIVKLLAKWQNPKDGEYHYRLKFERVETFLRTLLDKPTIRLDVPRGEEDILVLSNSLRLPLESHGTGIHQLIILAIAALSEDNALFGIEEPEIHLHPVLQRRFLKFLREETGDNRYIITTHSQTMIAPAEDVDVIHLKMVDGVTIPTRITTDKHALEALDDLGMQASDLLQANAVIWVEGPSDRLYLKRWMELVNQQLGGPELIEGIDYAMMFYGGRLLSHLKLERDGEPDDGFIQLLRINQRSAIVMDSDRKKGLNDPLNATKLRVIAECEANGLHAWVTDGREIENYLTQRTVEAAVAEAGIRKDGQFEIRAIGSFSDSFERVVGPTAPAWCDYAANKVAWAHRLVKHIEAQDISPGLKTKVESLIDFIRHRPAASSAPAA